MRKYGKKKKSNRNVVKSHVLSYHLAVSHYRRLHAPNKPNIPSDITIAKTLIENILTCSVLTNSIGVSNWKIRNEGSPLLSANYCF